MADSYRLAVLKALTAHLKGISRAAGYQHDLGEAVFRGRSIYGQNDMLPMVSILESPRSDPGSFAGEEGCERKEDWGLMLQGWVHDDVVNPTDPAYALLDDVEMRLARIISVSSMNGQPVYPDEYLLGGSISSLVVLPGVVRPPMEQVSSKAFFYLPIRIGLLRPTNGV